MQALQLAKVLIIVGPAPTWIILDLVNQGICATHGLQVLLLELQGIDHDLVQVALGFAAGPLAAATLLLIRLLPI